MSEDGDGAKNTRVDPLATNLDWSRLIGERLEELLWGLLSDMGAVDMTWRSGTTQGVHAADGGRDMEFSFRSPSENGGTVRERWWLESKGRRRTVGKRLVQDAVLNASAYADVDVVVVATNSIFTNSSHDWVREWNAAGRAPRALLWTARIFRRWYAITRPSLRGFSLKRLAISNDSRCSSNGSTSSAKRPPRSTWTIFGSTLIASVVTAIPRLRWVFYSMQTQMIAGRIGLGYLS